MDPMPLLLFPVTLKPVGLVVMVPELLPEDPLIVSAWA
jgi:hypothetical protein